MEQAVNKIRLQNKIVMLLKRRLYVLIAFNFISSRMLILLLSHILSNFSRLTVTFRVQLIDACYNIFKKTLLTL